jgi:hypothetical protein
MFNAIQSIAALEGDRSLAALLTVLNQYYADLETQIDDEGDGDIRVYDVMTDLGHIIDCFEADKETEAA